MPTTKATTKAPVAWSVTVETDLGGSTIMYAEPLFLAADGNWTRMSSYAFESPFPELKDFRVGMYLRSYSDAEGTGKPFGLGYDYRPGSVELRQAEAMVKVLRKLDRKLRDLNGAEGYIAEGDFAGYLVRVGRVLGIGDFRVRTTAEERRQHAGEPGRWARSVDAVGLQAWVADRVADGGAALR